MPTFPDNTPLVSVRSLLNETGLRKNNFAATEAPNAAYDSRFGWEVGSRIMASGVEYICKDATPNAAEWVLANDASAAIVAQEAKDGVDAIAPNVRKAEFTATRAPLPSDDETQGYAVGSRWLWQGQEWVAALVGGVLRWLLATESLTPEHFGAVGDGIADDTAALIAWLENGGQMTANGVYLVAAAGPDAGGAYAVLRNSIYFRAGPLCRFVAGLGLDNDLIRISANLAVHTAKGPLEIVWQGGLFDQTLQANSTSVPWSSFYPVARPGVSGTAEGLSVWGNMAVGGGHQVGIARCEVRGATFRSGDHWQTAGGDSGLFIDGTATIVVQDCEFIACRDCGFYGSGLPSGAIAQGTALVTGNVFRNCAMGAQMKRQLGKITITGNRGINTAEVVGIQGLTAVGGSGSIISDNVGENAWHVVRVDDVQNLEIANNISINHGHKMANGSGPSAVLHLENAAVRAHGAVDCVIHGNSLFSVDPVAAEYVNMSVVQLEGTTQTPQSLRNIVRDNVAYAGKAVVREVNGAADYTQAVRNIGPAYMATPVDIRGPNSRNDDFTGVISATTTTSVSQTTAQTLKTLELPRWWLSKRLDSIRIKATGTITGTGGDKQFTLSVQGVNALFPNVTGEGDWMIEAEVISISETGIRILATLRTTGGASIRVVALSVAAPRPWNALVTVRTLDAADSVTQTLMAVLP